MCIRDRGCLVAAALLAGGGIAGLPGEPRPAALPPATAPVTTTTPSVATPPPAVTEIVAAPEVPEPPSTASGSSEIIARPEPATTGAPRSPRPRAPRGGQAPKDMANPYK